MRILFFIALLIFSASVRGQELITFKNDTIPYTLKYPSDWEMKIRSGGRVFLTSPGEGASDVFRENVNIGTKDNKSFTSNFLVPEVEQSIIESMSKSFTDFNMEKKSHFKFNGSDALDLTYTVSMKNVSDKPVRIRQIMFGNKGTLYTLTYTSTTESTRWDADGEKIMKSMMLK